MSKRIGILTSGGDCAGLNAVLRASTLRAFSYGWEILGIKQGTTGLYKRPVDCIRLTPDMFTGHVLKAGGTILGSTNRGNPFSYPVSRGVNRDITSDIIQGYHEIGLEALIVVGGDGSFKISHNLSKKGGWNLVGVPKTIDNDLHSIDRSIGFSTAVEVATEAIDSLYTTAASHERIMVVEVMGRNAGHIALNAGIAGGADVILIPEIPYNIDLVAKSIEKKKKLGHKYFIVVVSEAVKMNSGHSSVVASESGRPRFGGISHYISDVLEKSTGIDSRSVVLGAVQRGGQPISMDRIIASALGVNAVDSISNNLYDRIITWKENDIISVPIEEVISSHNNVEVNAPLVKTARGLGICLGDY